MNILSIETSCDETSVAVTQDGKKVLSNVVLSQIDYHKKFGGVIPELAARKHEETINFVLKEALEKANINNNKIDLVAVTQGPGLIGCLFSGVNAANTYAYIHNKPLIGVNHLIGHIYSSKIEHELKFPSLVLLISGGHTELFYLIGHFQIQKIGTTLDDAVGEVYDKVARSLNLGYPGGPIIEKLAQKGKNIFPFPRPYLKNKNLNFSFSGLKSYIIGFINNQKDIEPYINDICASFQESVIDILFHKVQRALLSFPVEQLIIAGGVAANQFITQRFQEKFTNLELVIPSLQYCTDQAAMIGIAAYFQHHFSESKGRYRYNLTGIADLSI
ncbi:tRNA (adenosine(37)-N6)-threonylcarbamoyltransferase complex transferase subunit TsaD ['Camptotheca acuminata' phytoplasma]|uniref:tRNA (adenosine(37)-N6)-threonylcarbamoyltransferase complex transferase subunit TsaD n=1 Tax='Camptotheca acuminata' phytoplasma TaxID=3239192 RepID=UPI00351A3D23